MWIPLRQAIHILNSGFTEKTKRDQLTVMNNVSGLADESKKSPSFWW